MVYRPTPAILLWDTGTRYHHGKLSNSYLDTVELVEVTKPRKMAVVLCARRAAGAPLHWVGCGAQLTHSVLQNTPVLPRCGRSAG